jgi:outer membrane protein TolC
LAREVEIEECERAITLAEGDAWTLVMRTNERIVALERSLEIASENLDLSTFAYNEGETSLLDVMQAQISWLQTYKNYLAAHLDYALAVAQYSYVTED